MAGGPHAAHRELESSRDAVDVLPSAEGGPLLYEFDSSRTVGEHPHGHSGRLDLHGLQIDRMASSDKFTVHLQDQFLGE